MNNVTLTGRLTKDVDIRYTQEVTAVANFTLAVERKFAHEGNPTADFVPIVVWGKTAEACGNHLAKGDRIGIKGRIQTRNYEATDGTKRYVTEVVADEVEFLVLKHSAQDKESEAPVQAQIGA